MTKLRLALPLHCPDRDRDGESGHCSGQPDNTVSYTDIQLQT